MIEVSLAQIARDCGAIGGDDEAMVTGVVTDTRQVSPGCVFAAIKGERVDGATLGPQALEAGAIAVLTSDPELAVASGTPREKILAVPDVPRALGDIARGNVQRLRESGHPDFRIVAVTGSVGKTTTKDLLARILELRGPIIAPPGSFNNEIGLPLTVLRAGKETATLVLEMGADHVGNIAYLTSIVPPDVGAVLTVARAHLGEFGGIEKVAEAKAEMLAGILPSGTAVLNGDDERVAAMAPRAHGPVLTFSRTGGADVCARDIHLDEGSRASFSLDIAGEVHEVALKLVGEHHVTNALAAAACAWAVGVPADHIARALSNAEAASPHRMDVREVRGMRIIDDSYNANPDSMRAGIAALGQLATGRSIAVLGTMLELGEASEAEHDALGPVLAQAGVDVVVCVSEGTDKLAQSAVRHGIEALNVADSAQASELLERLLEPGDTVLLKGSNGSGVWKVADSLFRED